MELGQDTLIEDLKRAIAAQQCIVVVGAGVSVAATSGAGCASWTGLMKNGVARCQELFSHSLPPNWANRLQQEIESGDIDDLVGAAEKISKKLKAPEGGEYRRWLDESVGKLRAAQTDLLEAISGLGCVIATTNYDDLLESVTRLPTVTWLDTARFQRALRRDEPGVLHLHGHWQKPESVVLGICSYDAVLANEHAQHMQQAMTSTHSLLFIGCGDGLADANIGSLLNWMSQVLPGAHYRHFRLARNGEVAELQRQHPNEQRLFVIGYGENHNDLPGFVRQLAPTKPSIPTAPSVRPDPLPPARPFAPLPSKPRVVGRTALIRQLVAHLLTAAPAPVPVLGPPGMGKTNLALAVACEPEVAAKFGQRRVMVRCDAAGGRPALVAAISEALLLPLGAQQPELAVLHSLGQGPTLLILDNFETPWESDTVEVEAWLGLLSEVPGLCMLVTVRGVQRPMLAHWYETVEPRRLDVGASVQLFNDLAGRDFSSDAHLHQLLEAVDHVPLAITLLAPLAEGEPDLSGLWARWLHERTRLLQRAGGQDKLTNLELSYELSWFGPRMTDLARQLLQRLALLPSGAGHQDLQHLLPRDVEASVSLLRKVGLAYDEADRLRLLAPLREAILHRHPLTPDALRTITSRWLKRTTHQARLIGGKGGTPAVNLLATEVANVEAMGLLCCELDVLKNLIGPWSRFQRTSGLGTMVLVDHVIALADKQLSRTLYAWAIFLKGRIAWIRSQGTVASQCYEDALSLFKKIGDLRGQADCIHSQGELARTKSDNDVASQCFEQALNLYTQIGDLLGQANCLRSQGEVARALSDPAIAGQCYEQALNLYTQSGDLQGQANCLQSQGEVARMQSDHAVAGQRYEQALNHYTQIGDLLGQANCLLFQGQLARALSDHAVASQRYEQALNLYKQIGDLLGQANCVHFQGELARTQSDHAVADQCYELALNLHRQSGDLQGQGNCLQSQGQLALALLDHAAAGRCCEQAMSLFKQAGNLQGQAYCLHTQGELARAQLNHAVAGQCYAQAMNIFEQIGDLHGQANCTYGRGSLLLDEQQPTSARLRLEDSLQVYTRLGDRQGQAHALLEIGHTEAAQNDLAAASNAWRSALNVADERVIPFEVGIAHLLLARNVSANERENHVRAAARAWRGIDPTVLRGKAWWFRVEPSECEAVIAAM